MARKIWDTERKLHEMETAEISPTLEEKFDEMIRGEFKQVYENRMREDVEKQARQIRAQKSIETQLDEVKRLYPDFDLATEMKNQHFVGLVRAGVDFVTAYEVAHKDELITAAMAYAARRAAKAAADNIQARSRRAPENGASPRTSAMPKNRSVADMTRQERDALARRAMNGEKIML